MTIPIERFPASYDYRTRFPNIRRAGGAEGAAFFTAEDAGAHVLIIDESTALDIIGDEGDAVSVRYFASRQARDLCVTALRPDAPFKVRARQRQAEFRDTLSRAAQFGDEFSSRHPFLLGPGAEEENLIPALRGATGAAAYFRERGIRWWRHPMSGDPDKGKGPTRNMTSSQVACVNLFLPLEHHPALLTALLQALDSDIVDVHPVPFTTQNGEEGSSYVELEWTGRVGTLEGSGSRGAHATSVDACLMGITAGGVRRLYLFEFKYCEEYTTGTAYKGAGSAGDKRRVKYASRYGTSVSCLSGGASLEEVLYEPFYQIVRLGMLADVARADTDLGVSEVRVVVVCPEENVAYRTGITSPELAKRFPEALSVEQVAKRLWRDPGGFVMVDPHRLIHAVRDMDVDEMEEWSEYMARRYRW